MLQLARGSLRDRFRVFLCAHRAFALTQTAGFAEAATDDGDGRASDWLKKTSGIKPRFYKEVTVKELETGYAVCLDGRLVKTPKRNVLAVPNMPLAMACAAEWDWQEKDIRPYTLPLTSLANTAIDQPTSREATIKALMPYLKTDTLCVRHEYGRILRQQNEVYAPLLDWARDTFGAQPAVSDSIFGPTQPAELTSAVEQWLRGLDDWELTAASSLIRMCKSAILGAAVLKGHLDATTALLASRLEEDIQIEMWGLVEGGHDIDIADARVRVQSAALFAQLLKR